MHFLILPMLLVVEPPKPTLRVGQPAPGVDALFADGNPYDPADLKGKFILTTWWSADDDATKKHFTTMREIRKEFLPKKRLQMISIRHEGEWGDWLNFQDKQSPHDPKHPTRPFYSDSKWWQAFHHPTGESRRNPFKVGKKPASFLIGPDGNFVALNIPDAKLREIVAKAVGKK